MDRTAIRKLIPPPVDVLIAVGLVAMGSVLAVGNARFYESLFDSFTAPAMWSILLSVTVAVVPVAFRRVFPLGSLLAVTAGMLLMAVYGVVEISAPAVAAFVALVSAGIYGRETLRDWARGLFAVGIVTIFVALFINRSGFDTATISPRLMVGVALAEFVANAGFVGLGWYLGDVERRRRSVEAELEKRNTELQNALMVVDSQAANEERLAIARDVHDIVGHTVSLLGVQAAAARRQVAHDPDAAELMLKTMENQSRSAVDEIRSLITVLRNPSAIGSPAKKAPTPSFEHLDDLIAQVESTGTSITYSRSGGTPLGAGLGLSVYRVVQEALSNAIRHGAGNVEVVITSGNEEVRVFVANDVNETGASEIGQGRGGSGLPGMRERVGLHGGELSAGRNGDRRFEVKATVPVVSGTQP
jgi:signal transduction histidine kinase